jgi:hypothetical protein
MKATVIQTEEGLAIQAGGWIDGVMSDFLIPVKEGDNFQGTKIIGPGQTVMIKEKATKLTLPVDKAGKK